MSDNLLPCPFCGGHASIEEVTNHPIDDARWSAGCGNEDCIGYQSLTSFPRKCQARDAWNTRGLPDPNASVESQRDYWRNECLRASMKNSTIRALAQPAPGGEPVAWIHPGWPDVPAFLAAKPGHDGVFGGVQYKPLVRP